MRYNRTVLLAAAEDAVKATHAAQKRQHAEEVRKQAAAVKYWNDTYGESWTAAVRAIGRKLRAGTPVTSADLPSELGRAHSTATFNQATLKPYSPWTPSELETLIKVLQLVADEFVTTAALRDLGITASTMRSCAEYMARGTVRA